MTYDEFVKNHIGKECDYDGSFGVQCVDLIKAYLKEVFGIHPGSWGDAKYYWLNFNKHDALIKNFDKIKNTPTFKPRKGDICIWSGEVSKNNDCGHIAISTGESTTSYFYSYDQNWKSKKMKKTKHTYKAFYGVLRPKNQNLIVTPRKEYVTWQNGRTKENVYKVSNFKDRIGYLNPHEKAWSYGKINGSHIICYNILGGFKVGFCRYSGKAKDETTIYNSFKLKKDYIVFADTVDKEKIGSVSKGENVYLLGEFSNHKLILYKLNGQKNYKTGFIK